MTFAYDYPLLSVFWSIVVFSLFCVWIMTVFHVIGDVFRSRDMGGVAKAGWLVFVIALPFLGVACYLLARGTKMEEHVVADLRAQDAAFESYVKQAAGTASPAEQVAQLDALRKSGAITDAEYQAGKAKILV